MAVDWSAIILRWSSVLSLVFCVYALPVHAAPPVVALGAVLTRVSDGNAPFATVDPNGNNGLVATLDSANYSFDISVNTLDAAPHTVNAVTIVGTLGSASDGVSWLLNSLPAACSTKTLSVDGKTVTCILSGSYATGTSMNVSGSWFANSDVPNGTDVDASFTVSATMVADASGGDNPTATTSSEDTLTVVSEDSDYEVRKVATSNGTTRVIRDVDGDPISLEMDWGIQVEVKSPETGLVKGISSANLGDLTLSDNLAGTDATQTTANANATLVGCRPAISTDAHIASSSSATMGDTSSVQDSGSWSCSQGGGAGTAIDIAANSIEWAPDWYTMGKTGQRTRYWAYKSGATDETYNSPSGENNQAVVATQIVTISYPFTDILALDNTAGDKDARTNYISWCNQIGDIAVDGGGVGVDDSSNNQACATLQNTTGVGTSTGKYFTKYGFSNTSIGPEAELGLQQGGLGTGGSDNYLAPGQRFGITQIASVPSTSIQALDNWVSCDAIDQTKYTFIEAAPIAKPDGVGDDHTWHSWYTTGTHDPVFDSLTDSDIIVEFASTGTTWINSADQRTTNCDDGSLTWEADPNDLSGGLDSANLVRVRLLNKIPPGVTLAVIHSVKAKESLVHGDLLMNFYQFKTSTLYSNAWRPAGEFCIPENSAWNATSGTYGCAGQADRAYVIQPAGLIQKYDTSANADGTVSIAQGSNWTYHIKAGMAYNTDVSITGAAIYDTLPPGLEYVSSTLTPSANILDCNGAVNPDCITDASARTDYGYRTLRWDRGDATFTHSGSVETPSLNDTLFGNFTVTARVAEFVPNTTLLQNKAWLSAETGLQALPDPIPFRSTNSVTDDRVSGPYNDDWVRVTTAQSFNIEKYISQTSIPLNGVLGYNLAFGNLSGASKTMDAIDIFPWVGDGRTPASAIDGGYTLTKAQETLSSGLISAIYVTDSNPATLNSDPNDASNPTVGTGKWACQYSQLGSPGCPTAETVTAVRIVSNPLASGQYGMVRIELTTSDNDGAEVYTNNWQARASTLALPMISSDVSAETPSCLAIGNLVFVDANKNGRFDDGDQGVEGALVELIQVANDELYKTAVSDADGRWRISCIAPGEYYVRLPQSNFDNGGILSGYVNAPHSGDSANEQDEEEEHDLDKVGQDYRTQPFTVGYDNPLGETGSNEDTDALDNLTFDLGVVLGESDEQPETGGGTDAPPQTSPPALGITGTQTMVVSVVAVICLAASRLAWSRVLRTRRYYSSNR